MSQLTVTHPNAARYGKPERVKIDGQAYVIAEDGEGGFLILLCELPETEGQTMSMSQPADDEQRARGENPGAEAQAEAAAKHEQERELAASKGEALPGDPAPAPARAIEPEDERKKGGGDMPNPADAQHALNIRPDVVATPAGLETITTMKSQHYDAYPDAAPQEPAQTPGERDASPEAIIDRQNAASAERQEAELAASTGAAPQQAADKSGMSYEERLEARAEESRQRHAAEAEAAPERGQEVSMGRGE